MDQITEVCAEFICGCCPNEEFMVGTVTKKCTKVHDVDLKNKFMKSKGIGEFGKYVKTARIAFQEIISDVDKKINHNNEMLQPRFDSKIMGSLEHVENLIANQNVDNFSDVHTLLLVHGKLIEQAEKSLLIPQYQVCENCSVFMTENACKHKFCQSYKKIRNLLNDLNNLEENKSNTY
ncbi:hypothetical protein NUSPORA_00681 [Nucleospora cyclopteri]